VRFDDNVAASHPLDLDAPQTNDRLAKFVEEADRMSKTMSDILSFDRN